LETSHSRNREPSNRSRREHPTDACPVRGDKMTEATATVVVAALTFLTVVYNSFTQRRIERTATEVNEAVNMRHTKRDADGNVPKRLYDLVIENHCNIVELSEWKDGFDGSKLGNAESVNKLCDRLDLIEKKQDKLIIRPPCIHHYDPHEDIHSEEKKD
jgi:hypothetical protein